MDARAILFTDVNQVTIEPITVPDPEPGEALVEIVYSTVSPGTELRCLAGRQPGAAFPFIPGYSSVGRVIAGSAIPVGTWVFSGGTEKASRPILWGGHVSHVVKPESKLIPIPDGVDPLDASLAKLAAIAYHGVRHSRPLPHEQVAVIGLGAIGQLSARLHALAGARVCAVDLSPARVDLAAAAGIEAFTAADGIIPPVRRVFPNGVDIVVDSTGAAPVLAQAIRLAKDVPWDDSLTPGSRLLIQGSYPADVPLPYQAAFMKEVTIYTPRDNQPRDLAAVLSLMARGRLQVRDLISQVAAPDGAGAVYEGLAHGEGLTAVFQW